MTSPVRQGIVRHQLLRAVQRGLLTDYKVLVLTVEESTISRRLQEHAEGREQPAQSR